MPDKIPDRSTLNEEDFKAMMERIEASNAGQEKYAKKQYRMSQITALCSILVLIIVIYAAVTLIPKANTTFQNLNLIMEDLDTIYRSCRLICSSCFSISSHFPQPFSTITAHR